MNTPFSPELSATRDSYDTEPLSWVMGEIREALARSRAALYDAVSKDEESQSTLLRHAKTYLHQAHGALQVVDIGGVAVIAQAVEDFLERAASGQLILTSENVQVVGNAYQAFVEYLEELLSGANAQPVRLFPYYKALLELGNATRIHPADLFFPHVDRAMPHPAADRLEAAAVRVDYPLLRQRFEKELLSLLKSNDSVTGSNAIGAMLNIIAALEQAQNTPHARRFWRVMHAYAELAATGQADKALYVKQLFGKINLQIRCLVEGSAFLSEGLLRDALFFLAQTEQPTPLAREIREIYNLEGVVPHDYGKKRYGQIDVEAIALAKESLTQAKNLWSRAASGNASSASMFEAEMSKLAEASLKLNAPALSKLIAELNGIARSTNLTKPSENLGLEIASSLLFIENALDQIRRLADDFPQRAEALTARLLSLVAGDAPLAPAEWLDDLTRQAQERETVTALAVEMKTNLRQVEKLLDEYFIDPTTHEALLGIDPILHQIGGALAILEQEDAKKAIEHTQIAVAGFAQPKDEIDHDVESERQALQNVAQNISALGFFIEMLPQHPESAKNRFAFDAENGIFRANLIENPIPPTFDTADFESVALGEGPAQAGVQGMRASEQPTLGADHTAVNQPLLPIAVVLPDVAVGTEDKATLAVPQSSTLAAASEESDEAVDAELLEIFMSEAEEVLAFVKKTVPESHENMRNQDCLATLRRSFHTLKGSGRMVGLTAFANAAGSVEQVLNLWLSEERAGTADLYTLLEKAEQELSAWVSEINKGDHSRRHANALISAADGMKMGGPYHYENNSTFLPLVADDPAAETIPAGDIIVAEVAELEVQIPEIPTPLIDLPAIYESVSDVDAAQGAQLDGVPFIAPDDVASEAPEESPMVNVLVDESSDLIEEETVADTEEVNVSVPSSERDDAARAPQYSVAETGSIIEFPRNITPALMQDDNIKQIGELEIGVPLFNIYLAETDEIVRLLAQDFSEWRHEPYRHVSTQAIHAAHSLGGSSATVGFQPLQKIAHALEMVLQSLARRHVLLTPEEFDTLALSVEHQKRMLQKFALGEMSADEPELVQSLAHLQDDIVARAAIKPPLDADKILPDFAPYGFSGAEEIDLLAIAPQEELDLATFAVDVVVDADAPEEIAEVETLEVAESQQDVTEELAEKSEELPENIDAPMQPEVPETEQVFVYESADEPSASVTLQTAPSQEAAAGEVDENITVPPAFADVEAVASNVIEPAENSAGVYATVIHAMEEHALSIKDELDVDLLPVFLEEGRDLLPQIGQALQSWQQHPSDTNFSQSVLRLLHTVKGSARMAGAMRLGQHAHEMESRIENIGLAGSLSALAFDDLQARYDQSMHLFELLQNPQPDKPEQPTSIALVVPADIAFAFPSAEASSELKPQSGTAVTMVRVRADMLDRLVNQAGEVSISRSKLETEIDTLRQSLYELTENMVRLRSQLREVEMQAETQITSRMTQVNDREFDPLEFDRFTRLQELTRMMAESVNDVASIQENLVRTVEGATLDLAAQARLTRDLQQDLMRVRMVPFASISDRLYRVTRQAAKEIDKWVNLDIRGASVAIDRGVLERMTGPFEHLLRNAVVHGIEGREARIEVGKNETGQLLVEIRQEGNEVVIQFTDDGCGLDVTRIREKAIALGLLEDGQEISDAEAADFIFQPGFSTAQAVTTLAGRGIGMDVVRSEAAALGGRIEIVSAAGKGARFTIHLPLTLAVTQVVLLSTGGMTYAVPSNLVEQVQQLKSNILTLAYNEGAIMWQGTRVPLLYLSALLGDTQVTPLVQQYSPVIILSSGNERVAIHVDTVLGNKEVVVKNIGPQLARMAGIAGATVLGSGDIVLILNPVALAQRAAHEHLRSTRVPMDDAAQTMGAVAETVATDLPDLSAASEITFQPIQGLRKKHIVMVVDDSLTVRRVTQRFLTREGYQVVLAKDGVDALEQLQIITPDVMLVDIEMPRMDGFDFTRNVRHDERIRHVPIIMITSRTADKHRNYAMELGVNSYFGKPFQEEAILKTIAGFVHAEVPS